MVGRADVGQACVGRRSVNCWACQSRVCRATGGRVVDGVGRVICR